MADRGRPTHRRAMPGKRSHHGPDEDRARKPQEDRGARRPKMRARQEQDADTAGLSKADAARLRAWKSQ